MNDLAGLWPSSKPPASPGLGRASKAHCALPDGQGIRTRPKPSPEDPATGGDDYAATSIGLDFGAEASGIKIIYLVPDAQHQTHRLHEKALEIYVSSDNMNYTALERNTDWTFAKDENGAVEIVLTQRRAARYLKIHVKFDDRAADFSPKEDAATFLNILAGMIQVYQESGTLTEDYAYDLAGNRTRLTVTIVGSKSRDYTYYAHSNRLQSDGRYTYTYDRNGNLTGKTDGTDTWQYEYNVLNRLTAVWKNGIIKSEYKYDPDGLRVWKQANGKITHYIFEGTEPIYEKRVTEEKSRSYIYALGKHLARVDGTIGSGAAVYYYHTDHLGSVRAVTDGGGDVVWSSDYKAFGARLNQTEGFDEWHTFTGKEYDPDAELYYFNARWYDPELGRFISEDPIGDPNNPNLYVYGANNPLRYTDPTGNIIPIEEGEGPGGSQSRNQPEEGDISARPVVLGADEPRYQIDEDGNRVYTNSTNYERTMKYVTIPEYDTTGIGQLIGVICALIGAGSPVDIDITQKVTVIVDSENNATIEVDIYATVVDIKSDTDISGNVVADLSTSVVVLDRSNPFTPEWANIIEFFPTMSFSEQSRASRPGLIPNNSFEYEFKLPSNIDRFNVSVVTSCIVTIDPSIAICIATGSGTIETTIKISTF